jgi:hypothetical protein
MNKPLIRSGLGLLCAVVLLAACGGGGDDNPPPATSEVPASASASVDGFISYLKALVASVAEMLEPVDVSAVTPPASETAEPTTVD